MQTTVKKKGYSKEITIVIASLLALLLACNSQIVFEQNKKIDPEGWAIEDTLVFEYAVKDTTQLFDIFLNVRNDVDYEYSNLFVFFQTRFPDGRIYRDTVEMTLADRQGKWTGRGVGSTRSNSFHFRKDVWFPMEGTYEFTIQHAMRMEVLSGITDMGIRLEYDKSSN
jgi:gliding motility-associated lipoprotein GldH